MPIERLIDQSTLWYPQKFCGCLNARTVRAGLRCIPTINSVKTHRNHPLTIRLLNTSTGTASRAFDADFREVSLNDQTRSAPTAEILRYRHVKRT